MKKINVLLLTIAACLILASCGNSYKEKSVELNNQTDSLNYAFGFANGCGIKTYYFKEVKDENKAIKVFIDALKKNYDQDVETEENDQLYQLGLQVGNWFKQQKETGLFDSGEELPFDYKKVKEGLINGANMSEGVEGTISIQEAEDMINRETKRIADEKMKSQEIDITELENDSEE